MPVFGASVIALASLALPELSVQFVRSVPSNGDALHVAMFLDPTGKVLECEVISEQGLRDDARTERLCNRLIGDDAGEAAIAPDGSPAYGEVRFSRVVRRENVRSSRSAPSAGPGFPSQADLELFVADLPDEAERMSVDLIAFVDEAGHVTNCAQSGSDAQFSEIAYQFTAGNQFDIRHDAEGAPTAYAAVLRIDFVREDAQHSAQ